MKLQLYYPSRPYRINQKFGASESCCENNGLPIAKRKVATKVNGICPTGYVELYPLLGMKGHTGLDLYATRQTVLRSVIDGVVEEVQTEPERGLGVGVVSHEKFEMAEHGTHYVKVRQWHLRSINVKLGDQVKIGDAIGIADSTGLSSGDHNHFELKPVEKDAIGYYNVFQSNGYYGAVNPEPFFTGIYAEDKLKLGLYQQALLLLQRLLDIMSKGRV